MGILTDFQKAVYARLTGDSNFDDVSIGDWPDADTEFPHVTIGEDEADGDRDKSGDGRDIDAMFHIWSNWSDYRGWIQAKDIADNIQNAFFTPLDLSSSGWQQCGPALQLQRLKLLTEDEGRMRHLVLPLKFLLKEVT